MVLALCPYHRDFTEFSHLGHSVFAYHLQRRNSPTLLAVDTNVWGYYTILRYELVAFILNAKGVWDFCLGGLNFFFCKIS
ncbi:hypothetical protein DD736_03650 [Helicobacter pylori]|nr:hypothetical protein DD736_03650 [Helicobacter pylori]